MSLSMYGKNGQSFSLTSLLIALKIPIQNKTGENSSDYLNAFHVPVTKEGRNRGGTTTYKFWKKLVARTAETLEGFGMKLALETI